MTQPRLAMLTASVGAALLSFTAAFHFSGYGWVTARAAADLRPIVAATWVAAGASLIVAALLAVAVTPLFIVRRRALLAITALIPLSIAILQMIYLGFMAPTALLLLDAALLLAAGELGRARQALPQLNAAREAGV